MYLIPEIDLNEVVRRMNAERLAEWQDTFSDSVPEGKTVEAAKIEPKLEDKVKHILMPLADTYALGVQALREAYAEGKCHFLHPVWEFDDCNIVRPLTFKENIRARVEDYERVVGSDGKGRNKEERLRLFSRRLGSCTGIAYKAGTTEFKIIPISPELVGIKKDFNSHYIGVNYDSLTGIELDSASGSYNQELTKSQVLDNPGWITALEEDKNLLQTYADIVFKELKQDKAMGFYVRSNIDKDELRALFVDILVSNSDAGGNLYNYGSFLQVVAQSA